MVFFMDYISLKYIITVDKFQSISKAADELYLSQPNISKAIQNIEKEIGFQIFTRTSRGVTTTPEGKEFIKKAVKIVNNFEEFTKEFQPLNTQVFNFNIAHPKDIFFQSKLMDIAQSFDFEPSLNINVLEGTTEEIIDMVLKEIVNLGIICVNEHDLAYYRKLLILNNLDFATKDTLKLKATFHKSNPLSTKSLVTKYDLEHQTLITTNTNDYYKFYNEKYHLILSQNVIKSSVGYNQVALLSKVPNSYLISLPISDELLKLFNCKTIDLDTGIGGWVIMFVYKKSSTLTNLEKEFIKIF